MAFNQLWIDRYKAQGFFKHIEWNRMDGVLVKTYDKNEYGVRLVSFERGSHDIDYDQRINSYRQFFLSRQEALRFMLKAGFTLTKIAKIFRQIDGCQIVQEELK